MKKYLLDLNQTLVNAERGAPRIRPFELQIESETYRPELVEALRDKYVILMTARPAKFKKQTLARIKELTGWQPQEAYFAEIRSFPQVKKEHLLRKYILRRKDGAEYFAIESNPKTRAVYESYGIPALPYDEFLKTL